MVHSAMEAMRTLLGGRAKRGHQTETPVEPFTRHISPFGRKISYTQYVEKTQTAIIFDWDDTLFPTTYVKHDLGLSINHSLKDQALSPGKMVRVRTALARAACAAGRLLRLADERGKVVIVTLARSPWVTDSCRNFYPGMGELIKKLGIQIVYARDSEQIEHNKVTSMAEDQFETFWAETKGRAISKVLSDFYSQYEGQSWKNILSVEGSHFERYGTMAATMQYAAVQGLANEENGRKKDRIDIHVRRSLRTSEGVLVFAGFLPPGDLPGQSAGDGEGVRRLEGVHAVVAVCVEREEP
ncbi:unnamed protein product [Prorocentrum cordatum]|uniref:Uncharacterized protein n=1 Tax=Prorocentrum cordatum TaxID=2364126 RepID=A0ABN9X942_9DINO|nr:unnamed protein product [Polarella glacialis]